MTDQKRAHEDKCEEIGYGDPARAVFGTTVALGLGWSRGRIALLGCLY